MIDPRQVCLFYPHGCGTSKGILYQKIAATVGYVTRDSNDLERLSKHIIPVVGCTPRLKPLIDDWIKRGRTFIYFDRGYLRRIFATWLPKGEDGGYYRWSVNSFQMQTIRDVPADRFEKLSTPVSPWRRGGDKIVIAATLSDYWKLHGCEGWVEKIAEELKEITNRRVVIRNKESKISLQEELTDAHILVAHGSNAAIEAVVMGCPVCVHPSSAASLVGITDIKEIEHPIFPDREAWLRSLAYSQFTEREMCDGTLWRLLQ